MTTLTTDRLTLRLPVAGDFEVLCPDLMSERAAYMGGPFTEMAAWRDFAMDVGQWHLFGHGAWSVTDRVTGALLGQVSLSQRPDFPERELGWMVLPDAEGKGIAFEAASAARDYAFATLGWDTLVSYIHPANVRSIALAERLGATRDFDAPAHERCDVVYRHAPPEAAR